MRELRDIRLRRGLSQADLSAKTGVAEFTISQIEAGKRANPRPSTLRKLAQALDVEVADLFGSPERPLAETPPSQEKLFNNGILEKERRAEWDAAVRSARELRDRGRTRMGELLSSWRESRERREAADARSGLRDEMGQLLQAAFDARRALQGNASDNASTPIPIPEWEEIVEADRVYWALREIVERAGLYIRTKSSQERETAREGQPEVHNVEELAA